MGHRCCSKQKIKRGLWSPEEDEKLMRYITTHGHKSWSSVPKFAGLQRCGKSCRLRWINYLRPDLKRGSFTAEEEQIIIDVHRILGNRWAQIAKHLPGRTDNEVKNFWNSCIKKKLISQGLDPQTHNLLSSHKRRITTSSANNNIHQNPNSPFIIHLSSSQMPNIIAPIIEAGQTPSSTIASTTEYHHRFSDLPCEPPSIENCIWGGSRVGDKDSRVQTLEEAEGTQAEVHQENGKACGKGIAIDDEEIREANNYNENVELESSNFDFGLLESVLNSEFMSHDDINYMDELAWDF